MFIYYYNKETLYPDQNYELDYNCILFMIIEHYKTLKYYSLCKKKELHRGKEEND